jgi:hypothetical protein
MSPHDWVASIYHVNDLSWANIGFAQKPWNKCAGGYSAHKFGKAYLPQRK